MMHVTSLSPSFTGLPAESVFTFLPSLMISPEPSCPRTTGAESERVAFVFMSVGAAYAAAFHSDENLVIIDFRDGIFSEFKFTGFDEIREFCHFSHFYSPVLFILLVFRGSHIPENLLSYAVKYITVRRKYKNIPRTKTGNKTNRMFMKNRAGKTEPGLCHQGLLPDFLQRRPVPAIRND